MIPNHRADLEQWGFELSESTEKNPRISGTVIGGVPSVFLPVTCGSRVLAMSQGKEFPETRGRMSVLYSHGLKPLGFQCPTSLHLAVEKFQPCLQEV